MATKVIYRFALTGGGTALDGLDGGSISDGDVAFVFAANTSYQYKYDDDSGVAESSPEIIAPDSGTTDGRWILQIVYTGGLVDLVAETLNLTGAGTALDVDNDANVDGNVTVGGILDASGGVADDTYLHTQFCLMIRKNSSGVLQHAITSSGNPGTTTNSPSAQRIMAGATCAYTDTPTLSGGGVGDFSSGVGLYDNGTAEMLIFDTGIALKSHLQMTAKVNLVWNVSTPETLVTSSYAQNIQVVGDASAQIRPALMLRRFVSGSSPSYIDFTSLAANDVVYINIDMWAPAQ